MTFQEFIPAEILRPYIKCFWLMESDSVVNMQDTIFPSGYIEFVFNLGEAQWLSAVKDEFSRSADIELMGQLTRPLVIQVTGKNAMLGIRFYAHSAAYFLKGDAYDFNDQVGDLGYVLGNPILDLHSRLLHTNRTEVRLGLITEYLLKCLHKTPRQSDKLALLGAIVQDMHRNSYAEPVASLAKRYNISSRYLQRIFHQHIGVTPKLYAQIRRFHHALKVIQQRQTTSLTSLAYECGYFDQSHFIREFKMFADMVPSECSPELHPTLLIRASRFS